MGISSLDFVKLRESAGLTADEAATLLGRATATVLAYERGDKPIPISDFRVLSTEIALAAPPRAQSIPKLRLQADLFKSAEEAEPESTAKAGRRGAFTDNMKLPIHRWYRYSAGFSADWATAVIKDALPDGGLVLDPFAGSGTTLLAAEAVGVNSIGLEAHPFVARIASAKLRWISNSSDFVDAALSVQRGASSSQRDLPAKLPDLLAKCYDREALAELFGLRHQIETIEAPEDTVRLLWLALTSVLRETSHVGTAQWQYVLPNKSKARVLSPLDAFNRKVRDMVADMKIAKRGGPAPEVIQADARRFDRLDTLGKVDLVLTSPPYPNNYDYADATRLEMTFWGEVDSWGGLHQAVRNRLICSCSQHSAAERMELEELLARPILAPIKSEISRVCRELELVRETKGGKKTYHTMVASYFVDLGNVWQRLRALVRSGGTVHFVVGDSAPYGVYVDCDVWLGELALAAGFKSFSFEKLRDRNTKWKNRKHTVPLHEGILTVHG